MKKSTKHSTPAQQLDFSDFSGGWNSRESAENIEQNELAEVLNMTYSSAPGRLRTRPGLGQSIHDFGVRIDDIYEYDGLLLIAAAGNVYVYDGYTVNLVGTLTGTLIPSWCVFGGELFVASGGKIQKYSTLDIQPSLEAIDDSPENVVQLYMRAGRLFCYESNSDTIRGSAVGDAMTWAIPDDATDADPVEVEIGYKIAGNIVGVIPSLTDVIVFKEGVTMRLVDEYPDWSQVEISRDEVLSNKESLANVAGYLFYLESSKGIRILKPTDSYAQIEPADILQKANPWVRKNLEVGECRLWNLKASNVLLVSVGSDVAIPAYYEYGLEAMPVLMWKFYDDVRAIVEVNKNLTYIAIGSNLHYLTANQYFEPEEAGGDLKHVKSSLSSKRYRGFTGFLIKRLLVHANQIPPSTSAQPVGVYCNAVRIADIIFTLGDAAPVYGNLDQVFGNAESVVGTVEEKEEFSRHNPLRQTALQIHIKSEEVPFELVNFALEYEIVGGSI